jgi:hypothetical protein
VNDRLEWQATPFLKLLIHKTIRSVNRRMACGR